MPRITRVYTRTGDDGTTGLGGGQRVPKDSLRIETYGTVDELTSDRRRRGPRPRPRLAETLARVQNELFNVGSDLCILEEDKARMPVPTVEARHVESLEGLMDELSESSVPRQLHPAGGPAGAAQLHVARTVCRRGERLAVALGAAGARRPVRREYLNRLSDALFVMARYENLKGVPDVLWNSRA